MLAHFRVVRGGHANYALRGQEASSHISLGQCDKFYPPVKKRKQCR